MDPDLIFFILAIVIFFIAYLVNTILLVRKSLRIKDPVMRFVIVTTLILFMPLLPYLFFTLNEKTWFLGYAAIYLASLVIGISVSIWIVNKRNVSNRKKPMLITLLSTPLGAIPILLVYGIAVLFEKLDLLGPCC